MSCPWFVGAGLYEESPHWLIYQCLCNDRLFFVVDDVLNRLSAARNLIAERWVLVVVVLLSYLKVLVFLSMTQSISAHEKPVFHLMYMLLWFAVTALPYLGSLLFKPRAGIWWIVIVHLVVSVLLVCDLWYYRGFTMFLSLYTWQQSDNLHGLGASIASMARNTDIVFVVDLPILLWLALRATSTRDSDEHTSKGSAHRLLSLSLVSFIVLTLVVADRLHEHFRENPLFYTCFVQSETMHKLSPLAYHFWDAWEYWNDGSDAKLSQADMAEIQATLEGQHIEADTSLFRDRFRGFNLLVIQIESLEQSVIGQQVEGQEICPRLNSLRNHSIYFSNFYEQVANGTSSDADLMTNTGLYPPRKGCAFFRFPHNRYPSLPTLLGDAGYSTVAMKSDKASYYNWTDALTHLGFERCIDASSYAPTDMINGMQSDSSVLFQDLSFLSALRSPWYAFVVTETMHSPFVLPDEKQELKLGSGLQNTMAGRYAQAVHYSDKYIGALLDTLEARHLLDSTLVVLYGDHCSLHKYYNDEVRNLRDVSASGVEAQTWLSDSSERIPLMIYHKSLSEVQCLTFGGQVDLMQTLCSLLGIDLRQSKAGLGKNILSTRQNVVILNDGRCIGDTLAEGRTNYLHRAMRVSDDMIRHSYYGRSR